MLKALIDQPIEGAYEPAIVERYAPLVDALAAQWRV